MSIQGIISLHICIWICLLILEIVLEAITSSLITIWFIPGTIIAGLLAIFNCPFSVQLLVFAIISFVLLLLTKPIVDKIMKKPIAKTNKNSLIGEVVLLKNEIPDCFKTGMVMVGDVEWLAKSNQYIPANTKVIVKEISGVSLIVEPLNDVSYSTNEQNSIENNENV